MINKITTGAPGTPAGYTPAHDRQSAGIPSATAPAEGDSYIPERLSYTQMLTRAMWTGTGNGNPSVTGSPIQVLNAKLFNMSIAFGEMAQVPGTNAVSLELAFRSLAISLFEDADMERSSADTFLNNFFERMRNITGQNLRDTGMARAELAFHEAWNIMYFGDGGADEIAADMRQREAEQNRLMMEHLLWVARENAEVMRQWAEMEAEEAERWRKVMLIAARIARGDNVPLADRQFLMENSPGMYMIANTTRMQNDNPRDYESVLSNDRDNEQNLQYGGSNDGESGDVSATGGGVSASPSTSSNTAESAGQ